jgi:hypothetical protein
VSSIRAIRLGFDHAARAEGLEKGLAVGQHEIGGIIAVLRFLLGVQVVEVSEELVETMLGRQVFVTVALVVFAELAGGVAEALEHGGDGDVGFLPPLLGVGHADFRHPGADGDAAVEEGGAACGAGLLAVVIGEADALAGDAVDVRRLISHHAAVVVADVPDADVIAPDHQDVRLGILGEYRRRGGEQHEPHARAQNGEYRIHQLGSSRS